MKGEKNYYVVLRGIQPGVYTSWAGENGAEKQVKGYPGAQYKGFHNQAEAARWLRGLNLAREELPRQAAQLLAANTADTEVEALIQSAHEQGKVVLFSDGACIRNPGPGGYGAVLRFRNRRKEISGGYRRTTNNRMEIIACINGLKQLKHPSQVVVFSDSRYLVEAMNGGKALNWQAARWRRGGNQKVENADLWEELLSLCAVHQVEFFWLKGHAEYRENMRCDELATRAAQKAATNVDAGFEGKERF